MSDWYLGEIRNFPYGKVPQGWAQCNGQMLNITQNQALFALIGTTYGGNGTTTFALPDLRSRVMVGSGNPQYAMGAKGGSENVSLTQQQMPMHNHVFNARSAAGTAGAIGNDYISSSGTNARIPTPQNLYAQPATQLIPLNPASLSAFGSGGPHNNLQPYQVTNYCIATMGVFPARN